MIFFLFYFQLPTIKKYFKIKVYIQQQNTHMVFGDSKIY